MKPLFFHNDPQFWFETLRALGQTSYGGADIGEVATTAQRIVAGDYESWYSEWLATADRVAAEARTALDAGHRISARDGFLRASNYYRSAEFFLHSDKPDPRTDAVYEKAVDSFRAAAALFERPIESVRIPYEDTVLHGYFHRAAGQGRKPTVIMHSGFDGSAEECYFSGAAAGVERGYNVLCFDGPGQPAARHRDGLVFRPDWENVVMPVLDWLLAVHPDEVDAEKIALFGLSMGGLLAPRAAAFEPRLAACIANDGVFDLGAVATRNLKMPRAQAEKLLRAGKAPELDAALAQTMETNPTARWAFTHGMYVMGVDSPRKFLASYLDYDLNGIAEKIACPTLVLEAEEDLFFAGQPEELFAHLRCPKKLLRFTTAEGAGDHCHGAARRSSLARVYDWLDETLKA